MCHAGDEFGAIGSQDQGLTDGEIGENWVCQVEVVEDVLIVRIEHDAYPGDTLIRCDERLRCAHLEVGLVRLKLY